jgi:hypothetical protein
MLGMEHGEASHRMEADTDYIIKATTLCGDVIRKRNADPYTLTSFLRCCRNILSAFLLASSRL